MSDLNAQLLAAHEAGDVATLVRLYEQAAREASNEDARGFYLTHAYVFALESGDKNVDALREQLIDMGREVQSG